eukprot:27393-Rhodomonas_salina.1
MQRCSTVAEHSRDRITARLRDLAPVEESLIAASLKDSLIASSALSSRCAPTATALRPPTPTARLSWTWASGSRAWPPVVPSSSARLASGPAPSHTHANALSHTHSLACSLPLALSLSCFLACSLVRLCADTYPPSLPHPPFLPHSSRPLHPSPHPFPAPLHATVFSLTMHAGLRLTPPPR